MGRTTWNGTVQRQVLSMSNCRRPLQANFPPTWSFVAECIRNKTEQNTRELQKENQKLAEEVYKLGKELKEARLNLLILKGKQD